MEKTGQKRLSRAPERVQAASPRVPAAETGRVRANPRAVAFMMRNAGKGDIVHAGDFAPSAIAPLSAALSPDATLWVFQSDPVIHESAGREVTDGQLWNVSLRRAVAWGSDGRVYLPSADAGDGPAGYAETTATGPGTAEAVRLDAALPADRRVSVLSIDSKCQEAPALRGARRLITRHKPILILSNPRRARWFARHLEPLGYRACGRLSDRIVFSTDPVEL